MNVLHAMNGTIERYTRRLPQWVNVLIGFWTLVAALIYFGIVELPEIGWWRVVVMAPMAVILIAVLLQIVVYIVTWISAPARWLLKKRKAR